MSKQSQVPETLGEVLYVFDSHCISHLEGQLLTFIDASTPDAVQRKALKDLLSPLVWRWAIDANQFQYYEIKSKLPVRGSGSTN